MTTYVLVHGAFGGAHTWRYVRPGLQSAGADVFTPPLTGIGERWHLASPQVRLETHVEDVANTIIYWDLHDIVLLGYSYGGRVVSGALRLIADRVAHMVYLDTNLPTKGLNSTPAGLTTPANVLGAPWLIEPAALESTFYDHPAAVDFHRPRRTPQPAKTFTDTFVLDHELEDYPFSRTFIKATASGRAVSGIGALFWEAADRARMSSKWLYYEIETNHAVPENRPIELTEILLDLVQTK